MLRVLLVDDHAVVRNGIKSILEEHFASTEIAEAKNASEAMNFILENDWDIVVLDIRLPGMNGVELLKKIQIHKPKTPILVLSNYPESQYAVRLIKAGAAGYLSKDAEEDEIIKAVKSVSSGQKYISESVGDLLANHLNLGISTATAEKQHETLSNREFDVFLALASGERISDIAERMNVSAKTVTTHRARILKKMNFTNNAEMTLYARDHNLLL